MEKLGPDPELVFVEGNSNDATYEKIKQTIAQYTEHRVRLFKQLGEGKGDAVRKGFAEADGDILMILDADMTVAPEDLTRFYEALISGKRRIHQRGSDGLSYGRESNALLQPSRQQALRNRLQLAA